MATPVQVKRRLSPLLNKDTVYGILFDVIKTFEAYLIDFNLIQLEKGENIHGEIVGRYSRATELESLFGDGPRPIKPKEEGEPYNFQWTGGLFDGFIIQINGSLATFTSRDSKTPLLKTKYKDLFGLQPAHLQEAIKEKIGPVFIGIIRKKLQL